MLSPLALVFILSLLPQGDTGQLSGTVVDPNGAHILGARVKLISKTTSQVREVETRDSGNFAFTLLPPGRYKLEVVAQNFKTALIEDVGVNITQTTTLLVHLDVAIATPGILTIEAVTPLVQSESSQIGRVIEGQTGTPFSIVDAPNNFIIQRANFAAGSTSGFVSSRPIVGGGNLGTPNNPTFDPDNPFGNTPRNFLYGPGQKNLDLSVVRFIPIRERVRAELRTEFFNLFNWTNFANPNNNIAVPATFGRTTATSSGPRVIQFAFKVGF